MMSIVDGEYGTRAAIGMQQFNRLDDAILLLADLIPGAMEFLTKHPLRLMTLNDQQTLLGKFVRDGCSIIKWTRYTPPKDVGEVQSRYLQLLNRGTPNAMGLYYRLFNHPMLVLPVIFHEFLHYAGPDALPGEGVANETEVLVRETYFARALMARLAPQDDVAEFEREVISELEEVGVVDLAERWLANFSSEEEMQSLNDSILQAYGSELSNEEAESRSDRFVLDENIQIQKANQTIVQRWCPETPWPLLGEGEGATVGRNYRDILRERWQTPHWISSDHRDAILDHAVVRQQADAWEDYLQRKNSQTELKGLLVNRPQANRSDRVALYIPISRPQYLALENQEFRIRESIEGLLSELRHWLVVGRFLPSDKTVVELCAGSLELINQLIVTCRANREGALALKMSLRRDALESIIVGHKESVAELENLSPLDGFSQVEVSERAVSICEASIELVNQQTESFAATVNNLLQAQTFAFFPQEFLASIELPDAETERQIADLMSTKLPMIFEVVSTLNDRLIELDQLTEDGPFEAQIADARSQYLTAQKKLPPATNIRPKWNDLEDHDGQDDDPLPPVL